MCDNKRNVHMLSPQHTCYTGWAFIGEGKATDLPTLTLLTGELDNLGAETFTVCDPCHSWIGETSVCSRARKQAGDSPLLLFCFGLVCFVLFCLLPGPQAGP
jgi:hypothetical protein